MDTKLCTLSDAQLVSEFLNGKEISFTILYNRYYYRLLSFINKMVKHQNESEDLLQDVFLKAVKNFSCFQNRNESSLKTWLFTIANNTAIDFIRKRSTNFITSRANTNDLSNFFSEYLNPEETLLDKNSSTQKSP